MLIPDILIFALAVWRASVLIAMEDGPYFAMRRLRERCGVVYDEEGDLVSAPLTGLGKMITCVWCVSFWVTVIMAFVWWWDYGVNVVYVLGLWGAACAIQGIVMRE